MSIKVDIVIPVLNEEKALPVCISNLIAFLSEQSPYSYRIVIADNGSVDSTPEIAQALSEQYPVVSWIHLDVRGRGRALRKAWLESDADILSYMDVDLSTNLESFPDLVKGIGEQGFDLAIGSRLMKKSIVKKRTIKREFTSRVYNLIIKTIFFTRFTDAQCGFKAISRSAAQLLIPHVKDQGWFFDSELLILAEKNGFMIKDVPVTWIDDPDSRVNVIKTATDDLKGLWRLRTGGLSDVARKLRSN
ncbi:MAG: glycosyltransferase family 2 protein [Dehalococcoidia bacterium]|nr:glycosyltransferase family 2 protein [Dehalococcoidia bacterium]